ncbi:scavenger receptor [Mactra antiquata]
MFKSSVIVAIVLVALVDVRVLSLTCYQCDNVRNITECAHVVQCSADETCSQPSSSSGGFLLGQTPTFSCSQCCGVDLCNQNICSTTVQVNGGWTTWTDWSGCSVTCGSGIKRRSRDCSNPPPGPGGMDCVGDNDDIQICMETICYDGTWMSWSTWSTCTASCQGGISIRNRQCNTTLLSYGHKCNGKDREYMVCNTQLCTDNVIDGMWSLWSAWATCSPYCLTERTRTCTNPSPSMYGKNCLGNVKETKDCNPEYCSKSVRLVNGSDPYDGRLEVFHNGQWGTVCDTNFDDRDAMVVCRMLSYTGIAKAYHSATHGEGTLPILLDSVDCSGSEKSIFDCTSLIWGSNKCHHSDDVSVSCHPSLNVSLVNGTDMYNGRVMISIDGGKWESFCDDDFNRADAQVICRMLGFPTLLSVPYHSKSFGQERTPRSTYYDFGCSGSENSLTGCNVANISTCNPNYGVAVGVACGTDIAVRLRNGTNQHNGRVEISVDGHTWGTLCDRHFTKQDATVICRKLGLPTNNTMPYNSIRYGLGTSLDTVYSFGCSGSEGSLAECDITIDSSCNNRFNSGVDCPSNIGVRLVNGSSASSGRVEVSFDGTYYEGICDNNFGQEEARVVCRTLGKPSTEALAYIHSYFGAPGNQTNMLRLDCKGNENNIADCNLYADSHCGTKRVSGVWCSDGLRARLVDGSGPHDGRLEISLDGSVWGTVCNSHFGDNEAKFICSLLGFPTNLTFLPPNLPYGIGTLKYIAESIRCHSDENNTQVCNVKGGRFCSPYHEVGVFCSDKQPRYRLVDGVNGTQNGRLEMSVDGSTWGTVCNDFFGATNARVACRSLGLPSSKARVIDPANGRGAILLDDVRCKGNELSILDCGHGSIGQHNCGHFEDVGIYCE